MKCQAGWSTSWNQDCPKDINNLRYADDITHIAESEEELESLLMKVKEESEQTGLNLNIQKTKIMASGPITLWQIDGKQWKQWQTILGGSKITVDSDCSHEIKRHLLREKKAMTNLDSVLKSQGHYFADKGPYSISNGFFQ